MQLLNSINMNLQNPSGDWQSVIGLKKCMEYNMRGGNIMYGNGLLLMKINIILHKNIILSCYTKTML